ncbi:MAG: hypothetical protein SVV80_13305 [Planctomycetota bacterium]|nr:hypothetical protein [Planctomycetota bacterium]
MEKHFLDSFVEGPQGFRAEPWYNPHGDCIIYQTADEAVVADRVDEILTVYRSAENNRPIGFQIKGVSAITRKFGLDGLAVKSETKGDEVRSISIFALLLAAYESRPPTLRRREAYAAIMEEASGSSPGLRINEDELMCV